MTTGNYSKHARAWSEYKANHRSNYRALEEKLVFRLCYRRLYGRWPCRLNYSHIAFVLDNQSH